MATETKGHLHLQNNWRVIQGGGEFQTMNFKTERITETEWEILNKIDKETKYTKTWKNDQ